jgi:hypothetical protein
MYGNHRIYLRPPCAFSYFLQPQHESNVCACVSAIGRLAYHQAEAVTIGHQLNSHLLGSDRTKWRPTGGRR